MQKDQFYQIAIDGPVAAGKGTAAKQVAQALGYLYVDTGAMYRAACLLFLEKGLPIDADHQDVLVDTVKNADFDLQNITDESGNFFTLVRLDGRNVSKRIRQQDVDLHVSATAALPAIRELLVEKQRHLAETHSVVMEGRDIGTHVLPHATLKVFLTASLEVRAARRFEQLGKIAPELTLAEVTKQIEERDYQDSHRDTDPLTIAPDAIVFDTSGMTIADTVAKLLELVKQKTEN